MRAFSSATRSSSSSFSGDAILASFGPEAQRFEGNNIAAAMEALANADAVCFDVDSTVIQEEGIVSPLYPRFGMMFHIFAIDTICCS